MMSLKRVIQGYDFVTWRSSKKLYVIWIRCVERREVERKIAKRPYNCTNSAQFIKMRDKCTNRSINKNTLLSIRRWKYKSKYGLKKVKQLIWVVNKDILESRYNLLVLETKVLSTQIHKLFLKKIIKIFICKAV